MKDLLRFFGGRLLRSLVTLLLFQVVLFSLIKALPENIPEMEIAISALEDLGEVIDSPGRTETPAWQQLLNWMTGFYGGDLGESRSPGSAAVMDILAARLPRTLMLLLPATAAGFLLGNALGKRVAWRRGSWLGSVATLGGTAFYTSFPPWLAFVMINAFGLSLGWFPPEKLIDPMKWAFEDITLNEVIAKLLLTMVAAGVAYLGLVWLTRRRAQNNPYLRPLGGLGILVIAVIAWTISGYGVQVLDILYHLVLPLATLTLLSFGETMLVMKTVMSETVGSEYVKAARAKGLRGSRVRDQHAARVAIIPVLSRFIVHLPYVIIGSFVLEHVFFWDGMGQELVRAANENDLPVILGVLSLVGVGILLSHLIFDVLTVWLDPRLRGLAQAERTF
jgi:peptide/nickel transport system permease protein